MPNRRGTIARTEKSAPLRWAVSGRGYSIRSGPRCSARSELTWLPGRLGAIPRGGRLSEECRRGRSAWPPAAQGPGWHFRRHAGQVGRDANVSRRYGLVVVLAVGGVLALQQAAFA